jgi:hypothetical protein
MMKNSMKKEKEHESPETIPNGHCEPSKPDQNHKILKGALYLLDRCKNAHRESFLLNGHSAKSCRELWPLLLRVRCDKKSINDLVQSLIKSINDNYYTIELDSRINPNALEASILLSSSRLTPEELMKSMKKCRKKKQENIEHFTALKNELVSMLSNETLTWTRRYHAYNLLSRCLIRLDMDLTATDIEALVNELTNERPKWQAAAFYYTQTVLHKIKRARPREYLEREQIDDLPKQEELMYKHAFETEDQWNSTVLYADRTHQGRYTIFIDSLFRGSYFAIKLCVNTSMIKKKHVLYVRFY